MIVWQGLGAAAFAIPVGVVLTIGLLGPAPQDAREPVSPDPGDGGRARRSHLDVRRDRGSARLA